MTRTLPDLQRWMHDALLRPEDADPADAAALLTPNPRLTAAQSLAIYQQSYRLRIASCMREQFPALCHALGAGLFNDFVSEYVRDAPPESYTLYDLGRRFADFLEAHRPDRDAPDREVWIDFVVDLARFERSVFVTFDGPGAEDLPTATAQTTDAALRLNPSLSVARYRFPVAQYYLAVRAEAAPQPPHPADSCIAVIRRNYITHMAPLTASQYGFLAAMLRDGAVPADMTPPWTTDAKVRDTWLRAGFFVDGSAQA
ncbi:DNA-binding domain-containing protein [uncultured Tateyamaria sp.]|uniref:HvfC/BufC N-terminal domain-containing protein n=1 Tax=Tateyamaria sp. 1078 TaxID=3417464 RepID=UPI002636F0CA|nr:DNA-binding domain-containing protein [uncultured Tateyamaria sp.]